MVKTKPKKNPAAVAMAKARAASLTPKRRKEIAKKAIETRWERERERQGASRKSPP